MEFAHLHLHTEYSLLDGCCRITRQDSAGRRFSPLMDAVAARGQRHVAITDHGVMYGVIEFYKAALEKGLHPIIGCEVYVAPRTRFDKQKPLDSEYSHLVLLCENNEGYQNLIKMVSLSFTEGFYSKPRVDLALLQQYHGGLIALSACLAGEIPRALTRGDYETAREAALRFRSIFGADNFFLELQDHGLEEQRRINPLLRRLGKELEIGLVATNDVHYIESDDYRMHKVLLCVQTGSKVGEESPIEFKTNEFYLKTAEEMAVLFADCPEAIENTVRIAERCRVTFEFGRIKLPFFDTGGQDHYEYFRDRCYEGAYRLYGTPLPDAVTERLEYELSVIREMGYIDYYLIVWDFVSYAKRSDIPVGPGRGSGAGSLAAYCIGITEIDPLKYNLLFERFLNPERVSMPDFDIDFCYVNRQRVIDYVTERYGSDRVAQIVTFGTMAARAAIRDVGRAMDISYSACDRVARMVPHSLGMTIDRAMAGSKELQTQYENDPQTRELIDMARQLEGMPRHASTHAAGVVISDRAVSEYVPLSVNDNAVVTQYTMTALEELGLLKMDFLGLRNLTVIADTERAVRRGNPGFSVDGIPLNDPETYAMMGRGQTDGVFQFESDGMKNVLRQFRPDRFEDLIAILSLYRPGPMDSIPKYIHNRHHPEDVTYDTPLLKPILDVTYGCIVYQEQVMEVFRNLAGYSFGRADVVRRAMAKKKHSVMQRERNTFIYGETAEDGTVLCDGAVRRGVSEQAAQKIFDDMSAFSSYAFNKSHAAAYAMVAYRTAYLKCHYPAEYFAALLTSMLDNAGKIALYSAECRRLGIAVLPPSVNRSSEGFTAHPDGIRFGLLAVKNLGRGMIDHLIWERQNAGPFLSLYDFCTRCYGRELNRRALEGLIKSGALDGLADNRRQMLYHLDTVMTAVEQEKRYAGEGQLDLFSAVGERSELTLKPVEEMPLSQLLEMEKEATGLYLSGHPMDGYAEFIRRGGFAECGAIAARKYPDGRRVTVAGVLSDARVRQLKNKNTMTTCTVEDRTGTVGVTIFADAYSRYRPLLHAGSIVTLTGRVSEREDRDVELVCERIEPIPDSATDTPNQQNTAADKPTQGSDQKRQAPPQTAGAQPKSKGRVKPGLYIRIPGLTAPEFAGVQQLLSAHHGTRPVYLVCADTGQRLMAPDRLKTTGDRALLEALRTLLGDDNVRLVE